MNNEQLIKDLKEVASQLTCANQAILLDAIAALSAQTTHSVEDTVEYKLGFEAGKATAQQAEPVYERAKSFQAGATGFSGAPCPPQIVHYAGDDVTWVATFSREDDRNYFLSLLASPQPVGDKTSPVEPAPVGAELTDAQLDKLYTAWMLNLTTWRSLVRDCIAADRALKETDK